MNMLSWLRAVIKDELAAARVASPGPWKANPEHDEVLAVDGITVADGFALSGRQLRATVDHIVAQDPVSTIARCEAELAELAMLEAMPHYAWYGQSEYACEKFDPDAWRDPICLCGRDAFVDSVLRIKAYGRRRWLGWREEWAPSEG